MSISQDITIHIEPGDYGEPSFPDKDLGFGRYFTDRMFIQHYTPKNGWHDASIVKRETLQLGPTAHIFHCGQGVFEGAKAFKQPDGSIGLFRIDRNLERFNKSAVRMGMPTISSEHHLKAIEALVRVEKNWVPTSEGSALYIRPVMVATESTLEVRASQDYSHFIILSPVGPYFGGGLRPVSVYVSHEHVRAVLGGTGEAKTIANYAGSIYATEQAREQGFQQVLWLDAKEREYVEEVGGMNIAFVYGDHISTPALSGSILPGVTRASILSLAPDLGMTASEDRISIHQALGDIESKKITEVFAMGTGAVIAPVGRLRYMGKDYTINDNETGPVSQKIFDHLTGIQYGTISDDHGWIHKVDE